MKDFCPYYTGLLNIAAMYRQNKETIMPMLKTASSPVTILNEVYKLLVRKKEIEPIESLPEKKRREYWNKSSGVKNRIEVAKAYYLIDIL